MSGEVIQNGESRRDEEIVNSVVIADNKTVPVQLVQQIYKDITGKSERLGKSYDQSILLELDDLLSMNHAFEQALEQYNVCEKNCSISIFHTDDTHNRHSSFERFSMHSLGSPSSTETIHVKYNLMIILPKTQKMQTFTVSIRFLSRVAVEKRITNNYYAAPPKAVSFMGRRTAFIEVEYVDYMVARNIVRVFDDWYGTVKKNKPNKLIRFIQNRSERIPHLYMFISTCASFYLIMNMMPKWLGSPETNFLSFGQFSAISAFLMLIAISIAKLLGDFTENAIDSWSVISYIKITKGDEAEISDAKKHNKKSLILASLTTIISFGLALSNKILVTIIASMIISKP